MTPKLRKKCKLCRWKSCLEAGMSFGSMKMGRIPKKDLLERAAAAAAAAAADAAEDEDKLNEEQNRNSPIGTTRHLC